MKKLVLFVSFLFIASLCFGQSLPTDWTGDSDIDTYKEETIVHGGTYSCKIDVNSGTQGNCDFSNSVAIAVTGDDTYTVSFWAYTSEHVRITCVLDWSGSSTYTGQYIGPNTGGWSEFTYSGTVPTGETSVNIRLRCYDTSGFSAPETNYVDDVTFQSPTGTPLAVSNGDFELWPAGNTIAQAYAISADELEVFYVGDVTSVAAGDFQLTGTATITFTTATIDGANAKLVHLSGASAPMADDNTLDTISDEAKSIYAFYAGITSISYTNTLNPSGTIDDTHYATYHGIVSANNEDSRVWVSDATGAYNGVLIFDYSFDGLVDIGDEIIFTALRDVYNNLTELTNPELAEVVSIGNTPYGPDLIDGSAINETISADTNPAEQWEGQFVKIENFYVDSYDGYNYHCTWSDGSKTDYTFLVDDQAASAGYTLIVGSTYQEIIGVIDFNYSHYHINPRGDGDITLPVELSSFSAVYANDYVTIQWATASETDVIGFNVYRAHEDNFEDADKVNMSLIPGHGTTTQPNEYSFTDETADAYFTTYYYWLEAVNYGGTTDIYGSIQYDPVDVDGDGQLNTIVHSFLNDIFPNPVQVGENITFNFMIGGLEGTMRPVSLNIYNIKGELVKEVINEDMMVNDYTETWRVNDIANGVYFYQLKTENYQETKKLLIQ